MKLNYGDFSSAQALAPRGDGRIPPGDARPSDSVCGEGHEWRNQAIGGAALANRQTAPILKGVRESPLHSSDPPGPRRGPGSTPARRCG
jgi:hypothetical protein